MQKQAKESADAAKRTSALFPFLFCDLFPLPILPKAIRRKIPVVRPLQQDIRHNGSAELRNGEGSPNARRAQKRDRRNPKGMVMANCRKREIIRDSLPIPRASNVPEWITPMVETRKPRPIMRSASTPASRRVGSASKRANIWPGIKRAATVPISIIAAVYSRLCRTALRTRAYSPARNYIPQRASFPERYRWPVDK